MFTVDVKQQYNTVQQQLVIGKWKLNSCKIRSSRTPVKESWFGHNCKPHDPTGQEEEKKRWEDNINDRILMILAINSS